MSYFDAREGERRDRDPKWKQKLLGVKKANFDISTRNWHRILKLSWTKISNCISVHHFCCWVGSHQGHHSHSTRSGTAWRLNWDQRLHGLHHQTEKYLLYKIEKHTKVLLENLQVIYNANIEMKLVCQSCK